MNTANPRRLVFGEVAELYDASRPTYPAALIDDVLELGGVRSHERILEVGAGTGKATVLFAARGLDVLAIEPNHEMAAVARRNCAGYPGVEFVESDFEHWNPQGRRFRLLVSAQAWHWVDHAVGFERAHAALVPGGLLAPFWNRPAWKPSRLRDDLRRVYAEIAPDLVTDNPMHPANDGRDEDDWPSDVAAGGGFGDAMVRVYEGSVDYTADSFVALVGTLSEIRLLEPSRRDALLAAIRGQIERHGGSLTMPMNTRLCVARRRD
jgi:SAM-dependent methyltransferase